MNYWTLSGHIQLSSEYVKLVVDTTRSLLCHHHYDWSYIVHDTCWKGISNQLLLSSKQIGVLPQSNN